MAKKVLVSGHGWVDFPDDATEQEISATLDRDFPPPPPTVGETLKSAAGAFAQGATDTVASIPKAIGIGQKFITGSEAPVEETLPFRFGQGISDTVANALPEDPRLAGKSFWASKVPQAIGSTVGFAGAGLAGAAARVPAMVGTMATGAASGAVEGFQDAKAHGADDSTAFMSTLLNASVATTEAIPIAGILTRINRTTGGKLKVLMEAAQSAGEEAVQEAVQTAAADLIAQNLYDEDRKMFQQVAEDGAAGAVSGFLMTIVGKGIRSKVNYPPLPEQDKDAPRDPARGMVIEPPGQELKAAPFNSRDPATTDLGDITQVRGDGLPPLLDPNKGGNSSPNEGQTQQAAPGDPGRKLPADRVPEPQPAPVQVSKDVTVQGNGAARVGNDTKSPSNDTKGPTLDELKTLQNAIKANQLAPGSKSAPAPAAEPATPQRPAFDPDAPNPEVDRVAGLSQEQQTLEAVKLGLKPLGEWTDQDRQAAEALRINKTLKDQDRNTWLMIFERANNEDRFHLGQRPKAGLTAGLDERIVSLAKGEGKKVSQKVSKVSPGQAESQDTQNQTAQPSANQAPVPQNTPKVATAEASEDDIPMSWEEPKPAPTSNPAEIDSSPKTDVDSGAMLDFSKKLSEQDPAVKKAIEPWAEYDEFWNGDGRGFFEFLTRETGNTVDAEDKLIQLGITSVAHNGKVARLYPSLEGQRPFWQRVDGMLMSADPVAALAQARKDRAGNIGKLPPRGPTATQEGVSDDDIPASAFERPKKSLVSSEAPPTSNTVEKVQVAIDRVRAQLPGAAPVVIVQRIEDLPPRLRQQGVQGAFWRGKTYLVADNIENDEEAVRKFMHEQVGHYGLQSVLGSDLHSTLDLVGRRLQNVQRAALEDIARTYDLDPADPQDLRHAAEEYIARLAESEAKDPSMWQTIVAAIKKAWRKITGADISEDEIRELVRRAYRSLKKIIKTGEQSDPRYSLDAKEYLKQEDYLQKALAMAKAGGIKENIAKAQTALDEHQKKRFGFAQKRKEKDIFGDDAEAPTPSQEPPKPQIGREKPAKKANEFIEPEEMRPAGAPMEEYAYKQAVMDIEGATANPTADAQTWWQSLKRWLRNFGTSLPELPLDKGNAERFAAVRRWYRAVSSEGALARTRAERMIQNIVAPITKLGRVAIDPNTLRRYEDLTNAIQAQRAKGEKADSELIDKLNKKREALRPAMEKNPMHLFKSMVIWRDINYRTQHILTEDGQPVEPPAGMTLPDVQRRVAELEKAVEASEHKDAIKEALKRHYEFVQQMQQELEDHGEIIPEEMKNPEYFPHHILEGWSGRLNTVRATTEGPWRYYLQPITGTEKLHQSDYLAAMYKHAVDVLSNNAQVDLVERDIKPYDISERHLEDLTVRFGEEIAKKLQFKEKYLPPGYKVITPSERLKLAATYIIDRQALSEKLGKELTSGDLVAQLKQFGPDLKLTADDIREALTYGGEQTKWIVPEEVADALEGIKKREDSESNPGFGARLMKPLAKVQKVWKINTLFNPLNYPRYEYGNTMTDVVDKVWGLDPGMAPYLKRAFKEYRAGAAGNPTPEYDAALREGVFQTVTAGEAEELAKLEKFENFLTTGEKAKQGWNKFWRLTTGLSQVRESTFRFAKFLADIERIRKGERPVYGGALNQEVEAQQTPEQKAGLISRKTFGDYEDISVAGAFLRRYVFPFWSWQEVNLKYHVNLFRNMVDMVKLGEIAQAKNAGKAVALSTTTAAVGIALRLAALRLGVEMWNQFGGRLAGLWDDDDDLEAQLSETDRRRLHIIMGKDDQGRVRVAYIPNAFADVAEWFGGNNFARLAVDWAKGDISLGRFAKDFSKQLPGDIINKVAQGIRPEAKFGYMMVSGKDPFPDVLNQRSIDKGDWYWMLGQAMDRDVALALRSQLDPYFYSPESAGDWWQRKILQVRRRDPEQWAWFEIRDLAADWKEEQTGKRFEFGSYMSNDQKVIRNFRKAIYRGDMENAQKFYLAALDLGYTSTRFKASMKAQDPLADLNAEERRVFEASLNPYELRMLTLAKKYYGRLSSGKGKEAELFPKKAGQPFTPRPDRLESMMEAGRR